MWKDGIFGIRREDGRVGIRNLVAVLAAADNVNPLARQLAASVPGVVCLQASYGRGQLGRDFECTLTTLAGLATHPNIAACLVVSLEPESAALIADHAAELGRKVSVLSLLEEGGLTCSLKKGSGILKELQSATDRMQRESIAVNDLIVGLECGGSDTTSGLIGNPSLGALTDSLIEAGGIAIFSEPVECIGCESLLQERAVNKESAQKILNSIHHYKELAHSQGIDLTGVNPTPDNIKGGLSTIEEKSLGAVAKAGTKPIQGVLSYGQRPTRPGLWLMDAPAAAAENLTALAAAGCQVIIFVTGSGNPLGHPVSPTIKVCANPITLSRMSEHIDMDLSESLTNTYNVSENANRISRVLRKVINGDETTAERLGYLETNISRFGESV